MEVVEDEDPVPPYPGEADRVPRTSEELQLWIQSGTPLPPPPPAYFRRLEIRSMPVAVRKRLDADIRALRIDEPWRTSEIALRLRREWEWRATLSPDVLADFCRCLKTRGGRRNRIDV